MNPKACIFVDGENFRHTIVELFDTFSQSDYLPKNGKWNDFFTWLVSQIDPDAKRIRTYWYVIEWMDFYPHKFCDPQKETNNLKSLLCHHTTYKDKLDKLSGNSLCTEMTKIVETLTKKKQGMLNRFSGWGTVHSAISTNHNLIEFRKAGAIRYNLFTEELGKEKAVDVKLATDLIMLKDIYDIAIIVSGDQDYVPAVQVIKDSGKHVVNVSFKKRNGQLLPSGSWRLNQITDWSLKVDYDQFKIFMNMP
jgi:uncharacterized LabA/DUF88 family protein